MHIFITHFSVPASYHKHVESMLKMGSTSCRSLTNTFLPSIRLMWRKVGILYCFCILGAYHCNHSTCRQNVNRLFEYTYKSWSNVAHKTTKGRLLIHSCCFLQRVLIGFGRKILGYSVLYNPATTVGYA